MDIHTLPVLDKVFSQHKPMHVSLNAVRKPKVYVHRLKETVAFICTGYKAWDQTVSILPDKIEL